MKWVTRERPKIDRLACPWLVRRFIDRQAEILYVPTAKVLDVVAREGAIPFDVPYVELTHEGPLCNFDAFLKKYQLQDPALGKLAVIVRAADTDTLDNSPEAPGLLAVMLGLGATSPMISACRKWPASSTTHSMRRVARAESATAGIRIC